MKKLFKNVLKFTGEVFDALYELEYDNDTYGGHWNDDEGDDW